MADVRMIGSGRQAVVGDVRAPIMVYKDGDRFNDLTDEFAEYLKDKGRAKIIVEDEVEDETDPNEGGEGGKGADEGNGKKKKPWDKRK